MTTQPLDELYFKWLYGQVADPEQERPSLTYWNITRALYRKEFVWLVPNDDNRAEDGKALRCEFVEAENVHPVSDDWLGMSCSMLELMVGLARKLVTQAEGQPYYWFWRLMGNIGLDGYSDNKRFDPHYVDDVLDRVIFRTYKRNGTGGLFPLRQGSRKDQRNVELWYQLCAYVLEQDE